MKKIPRDFYLRPTERVALDLLGKIFVFKQKNSTCSGRIVEVEAYHGPSDAASHSHRGETARCQAMFFTGGHLYVYRLHRYFCLNVVTEAAGIGSAVLIRALEPLSGIALMQKRRNRQSLSDLCSGPGKIAQSFAIDLSQDKSDLVNNSHLYIADDNYHVKQIFCSKRIGITKNADIEWRFFDGDSPHVSKSRKGRIYTL